MSPDLDYLTHIAKKAGEILNGGYLKHHEIRHKGRIDLVTEMDARSEEYLLGEIRRDFEDHTIVTEESGLLAGIPESCWFIDPLDGTANYAHGVPIFSVNVAYAFQNRIVLAATYDPTRDHCFSAERGHGAFLNGQPLHVSRTSEMVDAMLVTGFSTDQENRAKKNLKNFSLFLENAQSVRRLGSAALDMAYVAAGWLDGYWEIGIHPWDIAAGTLLVEEAGGLVTDIQGNKDYFKPPYALIAANPVLHKKIKRILQLENA